MIEQMLRLDIRNAKISIWLHASCTVLELALVFVGLFIADSLIGFFYLIPSAFFGVVLILDIIDLKKAKQDLDKYLYKQAAALPAKTQEQLIKYHGETLGQAIISNIIETKVDAKFKFKKPCAACICYKTANSACEETDYIFREMIYASTFDDIQKQIASRDKDNILVLYLLDEIDGTENVLNPRNSVVDRLYVDLLN